MEKIYTTQEMAGFLMLTLARKHGTEHAPHPTQTDPTKIQQYYEQLIARLALQAVKNNLAQPRQINEGGKTSYGYSFKDACNIIDKVSKIIEKNDTHSYICRLKIKHEDLAVAKKLMGARLRD